jgi:hypothetical protein
VNSSSAYKKKKNTLRSAGRRHHEPSENKAFWMSGAMPLAKTAQANYKAPG